MFTSGFERMHKKVAMRHTTRAGRCNESIKDE
jgi:hypothetical protein